MIRSIYDNSPILLCACALLLCGTAQGQTTWYVDAAAAAGGDGSAAAPFRTIQDGIGSAITPGDIVEVAPGLYTGVGNRNLDFAGRAITVFCPAGISGATIDCENVARAFVFDNGEGADTIVDGFAILNGYAEGMGGGIYCSGSSPTIQNCLIKNCSTSSTVWDQGGAGAAATNGSSPTFIDCVFEDNVSAKSAGALLVHYCTVTCRGCTFTGNPTGTGTGSFGGGLYGLQSNIFLRDCTFSANQSRGMNGGGAIGGWRVWILGTNCEFTGNTGRSGGACVAAEACQLDFWNCLFAGNTGSAGSGAISCGWTSSLDMYNCAVVGNNSGGGAGGERA